MGSARIRRGLGGRRHTSTPLLFIGYGMFIVLVLTAIIAPIVFGGAAKALSGIAGGGPTVAHPLGTDDLGRDMLARTLVATRQTMVSAALSTALAGILGIGLGVATWLAPRRVREVLLRLIEFWVSYPTLLVAIVVAAILGQGVAPAVFAIGLANAGGFARLTANLAAGLSAREYVTTARLMGVPAMRIATRHILPNMAEPQLILLAQAFAGALIELSGLSFIGLGAQSPSFDWGSLLNDGVTKIFTDPVLIVGPSCALVFASLAALFVGDGLAAAANPRSATRRARMSRIADPLPRPLEPDTLLAIDHLTVRAGEDGREIISDVSLRIRKGEILGIVGESGSGKSVTASVVAKLLAEGLEASASRAELGGLDLLGRVSGREMARRVAMIYQDPGTALNPALTLGSQLTDVLSKVLGATRRAARQDLIDRFEEVLLTDPEGRMRQYPHQLSGGMKQRAMIASAMTTRAELLVADEPTTALDVTVQREVLSLIKRMNAATRTSVLFISHDLGVVRALCDRVLVMRDGKIVETIDDVADMTPARVVHPYTRQLLEASPVVKVVGRR